MRFQPLRVPVSDALLEGDLVIPSGASGLVVFAHGSGSSRFSPRNRAVARDLNAAGLGTLLLDLLTPFEEARDEITGELRFDIGFLAERLMDVCDWVAAAEGLSQLRLGLFGASTGAAAALQTAAERTHIAAVVSRGGRPDLARDALVRVHAPTLLIVGSADRQVLQLNRWAFERLAGPKALEIVPDASHLFEEPGALQRVAELARDWLERYLVGVGIEHRPSP